MHTYNNRDDTHTLARTKPKPLAVTKWSRQPSEPALGFLGTTQALRAGASKSTWERASTPQVGGAVHAQSPT